MSPTEIKEIKQMASWALLGSGTRDTIPPTLQDLYNRIVQMLTEIKHKERNYWKQWARENGHKVD